MPIQSPTLVESGLRGVSFRISGKFAYVVLNGEEVRCHRYQAKHILNAAIATPF